MRLHLAPLLAAAVLVSPLSLAQTAIDPPATPARSPAAAARPLTLPQALASAEASHPSLRAAQHELDAADGAREQSAARPNPTLAVEVEDTRRDTRATTLLLSQPIELGGKRGARVAAADRTRDLAEAQQAAVRHQLRALVTSAFFDAAVAQERVTLAEASLVLAEGGAQAASRRVMAGKISPVDETRARVAEAGMRLELLQARGEWRSALQALRAATGLPNGAFDAVLAPADALPASVGAADLAARLTTAPAVLQARRDAERLAALVDVERTRSTPDVTVSVGAKHDAEAGRNMAVVGVSIPLPLFGTFRGAEREAQSRYDKAVAEAQAAALKLEADALNAQDRLLTARTEVETLQRDVLPGAQSAYDAAVKGFELGKFGYLDVLDAQRTLLMAKDQYLRAWADTHRARIELDRLLGHPDHPTPAPKPALP